MDLLLNAFALRAQQAGAVNSSNRQGIITAYDPSRPAVKVQLQPSGEETGWIPLKSLWVGNGWGLSIGPMIGAVVEVDFDNGNVNVGSAGLQFFNDEDVCPGAPSGEFWLVHQSGSLLKFLNSGQVLIQDKAGSSISMNGDGTGTATFKSGLTINANTQINGWLKASKDISDNNGAYGTVNAIRATYNGHNHYENGQGSNTNKPNQQMAQS